MSKSPLSLLYCYCYYYYISFVAIVVVVQLSSSFYSQQQQQQYQHTNSRDDAEVIRNKGFIVVVVSAAKSPSPYYIQQKHQYLYSAATTPANRILHDDNYDNFDGDGSDYLRLSLRGGAVGGDQHGSNENSRRRRRGNLPPHTKKRTLTRQEEEEKVISALDEDDDDYDRYHDYYSYDDECYDDEDDTEDFDVFASIVSSSSSSIGETKDSRRRNLYNRGRTTKTTTTTTTPEWNHDNSIGRRRYHYHDGGMPPKFTYRRKPESDVNPRAGGRRRRDDRYLDDDKTTVLSTRKRINSSLSKNGDMGTPTSTYQSSQHQRQHQLQEQHQRDQRQRQRQRQQQRQHEMEQEEDNQDMLRYHQRQHPVKKSWVTRESPQQHKRSTLNGRKWDNFADGLSMVNSTAGSITNRQSGRRRQPAINFSHDRPSQQQDQRQRQRQQEKQYIRQSTNALSSTLLPPPPLPWQTSGTAERHYSRSNEEDKVGAVSSTTNTTLFAPGKNDGTPPTGTRDARALLPPSLPSHLFGQPQSQHPPQQRRQLPLQQRQPQAQRTKQPTNTQKQPLPSQRYAPPPPQTMPTTGVTKIKPPIPKPAEGANGQMGRPRQRTQPHPQQTQQNQQQPLTATAPQPPTKSTPKLVQTTMSMTTPWARTFILSRPKDALLPVPREFLADGFNLAQLASVVNKVANVARGTDGDGDGDVEKRRKPPQQQHGGTHFLYKAALRLILGGEDALAIVRNSSNIHTSNSNITSSLPKEQQEEVQRAAEVLYTLLHARYIASPMGLNTVRRMMSRRQQQQNRYSSSSESGSDWTEAIFGKCPRVSCRGMPLLPYGMSDEYDVQGIRKGMKYCCSCGETLFAWESKVDGSAWGPYFCHLFVMAHGAEIFPMLMWNKDKESTTNSGALSSISSTSATTISGVKNQLNNVSQQQRQQHQHAIDGEDKEEWSGKPIPKIFGFRIHPEAMMQYPIL